MTIPAHLLSNPLVNPPQLPNNALPLNKVKSAHLLPAIEFGIQQARAEIDAIKNNAEAPTFENTIEALEFAGEDLTRARSVYSLFTASKTSGVIRKLEKKIAPMLSSYYSGIFQDADLFRRVEAVYNDPASSGLGQEQKTLLEDTYKSFIRSGINLVPEKQKRFLEIREQLSVLSSRYSENVIEATSAFKLFIEDEARLEGIPERVRKEFKNNAIKAGQPDRWLIEMEPYPAEIMSHGKDRALREELFRARRNLACADPKRDNRPVILEMVKLKHELAQLMGFPTIADHVLSERMAGNAATVNTFLQENLDVYKPSAEDYLKQVADFAREQDGLTDMQPWDTAYYGRMLKEKKFSIDMESLRPYFELKSIFRAVCRHAEEAFDVELRAAGKKYPVHHKDVKVFEIFNKSSNSFVGLFYANYYARPGAKQGGAWMDQLQTHFIRDGKTSAPAITNDCNYKKNENGEPTLLTLYEAETMQHEFGHGAHGFLSRVKYPSISGTNVKWDFVELPSQLQEGWAKANARDPDSDFARHYITGKKIPSDILDRLEAMENFDAGLAGQRQTFLGMLDMKWHTTDPADIKSVEDLEDSICALTGMQRVTGSQSASFTHIFSGGYTAGYYGYKWADVMAADVFARSQEKGEIYDKPFLKRVREIVYESGGAYDPAERYRELMGRDPDSEALYRREGLSSSPKP
jgi:Zn-dependent oligopeptidase